MTLLQNKKLLMIISFFLLFAFNAAAQITTVWEKSAATSSRPLWFGADTERGLAYGNVGGNDRLYVVSRSAYSKVIILNALTGDSVGVLDTAGIFGGTYSLNDVGVSADGIIFAANMTTSGSTSAFKVYKWTSEAAAPVLVINYTAAGAYRMGDKITVVGSASDNSLKIYAPVATSTRNIIFTTTDNGTTFNASEVTMNFANSSTPSLAPVNFGVDGYYVKSNGRGLRKIDATNSVFGGIDSNVIPTNGNALRYFTSGSRKFLAVYTYGNAVTITSTTGFNERGRIFEITSNDTTGYIVANTPMLGVNANTNGTGDIDVKDNGNGTFTVYVISSNQGLGAYTFDPAGATGIVAAPYMQDFADYWTPPNWTKLIGYLEPVSSLKPTTSGFVPDDFGNVTATLDRSARINIYGTTVRYWLTTPTMDLGDGTTDYQFEYDLALAKYAATTADTLGVDDTLAVVISTDNGTTWSSSNILELFTASTLISNTGEHRVINLSAYSGLVKLGFYGSSTVSNKDNDIFIDNVQLRVIPSLPEISVNPSSHDFGGLQVGTSAIKDFAISNIGVGTLTISSAVLTGGISFSIIDSATYPVNLTNLQAYSVGINFAPATIGAKFDTLRITSNLGVFDVPLEGLGFDATINIFPYAESFDGVTFPPQGWLNIQVSGSGLFERATSGVYPTITPHSGDAMLQYRSYSFSSGTSAIFVSPKLNFTKPMYTVKFWMYRDGGYLTNVDRITVYLNNLPEFAGADSIGGVYRSKNLEPVVTADGWYEYSFTVPGLGNKYLILKATSGYGNNMYVDDFAIEETPMTSTNWTRSAGDGNLPAWFSPTGSTERGIGFGYVFTTTDADLGAVFVVSRNGGTFVKVLDDSTGADLADLNTTGISGGTYTLNDIGVTYDGKILAANLTTNASTSAFKVYMWDSLTSAPVNVISYTSTDVVRLGDKITVTGSYYDGTAQVWAASATTGIGKIYKFTMTGGSFNPVPAVIILSDNAASGNAAVGPLPNGDFYWNAGGQSARKYQADGTLIGVISGGIIATGSNAIRYLGMVDSVEYIATFQFGAGNENARIVGIPQGVVANAFTYSITPSLGTNSNGNGTGDVAFRLKEDGTGEIFVLSTNNGVGAYQTFTPVPVELNSFAADVRDRSVELRWSTATESNSSLFRIERSSTETENWTVAADVRAAGTSTEKKDYSFVDNNLSSGKYLYRLKMIDLDGTYKYSSTVEVEIGVPSVFALSQNYPNPFNPSTRINYQIPVDANVTIELFDITGQKIATLLSQDLKAGYHTLEISGLKLASGMYIYRMNAVSNQTGSNFMDVKKMMMLK